MGDLQDHSIQVSMLEGEVSITLSKGRSVFFRSPELNNLSYSQFDFALLAAFISSITTGEKLNCDDECRAAAIRKLLNRIADIDAVAVREAANSLL